MTKQRNIPTSIKKGTIIVECKTRKELEVIQDYRATDVPIGGHFQILARYLGVEANHTPKQCRTKLAMFQFNDVEILWDYK